MLKQNSWFALAGVVPYLVASPLCGAELVAVEAIAAGHGRVVPLVKQYCQDCHAGDVIEGDVDLSGVTSLDTVRRQVKVWQRVAEMVSTRQMPPPEADQPTDEERAEIGQWLHDFLKAEARARAGDPGRVVLRRLNNAEYTFTIRDLTGVDSLDPAKEFPADGGAGEGFTNTGQSLVMSPGLATKYLDAAKGIAAHAVLLPDGVGFSPYTSRQDWIDEILAKIRGVYTRYSVEGTAGDTVQQGVKLTLGDGGRLPMDRYLAALQAAAPTGAQPGVSPKYLGILRATLESKTQSPILDPLRAKFRAGALKAADLAAWQSALWRFAQVGQIGKVGGPKAWQEPIDPVVKAHEIRLPLAAAKEGGDVTVYLFTGDAGDGKDGDDVVWESPRIVARGRPDVPLVDLRQVAGRRASFARSTAACLAAAHEHRSTEPRPTAAALAAKHGVREEVVRPWLELLDPGDDARVPKDSLLAAWKTAGTDEERSQAAEKISALLAKPASVPADKPDGKLVATLLAIADRIPDSVSDSSAPGDRAAEAGLDPAVFGRGPDGTAVGAGNLGTAPPSLVEFRVPESLLGQDAAFVVTARLRDPAADGSVQTAALTARPAEPAGLVPPVTTSQSVSGKWSDNLLNSNFAFPILVSPSGTKQKLYESACTEFRSVFPLAVCYTKIVPTDEIVTLMLYHREDDLLCRLLLDHAEKAELDRLWAALTFVSEAPVQEVDVLEQITQFATQDADPKVFEPLREPYRLKAEAFRRIQSEVEPRHVDAVVAFAGRAFRRPLTAAEDVRLRSVYDTLRKKKLPHEEAILALLAHVLVSADFLYKIEVAGPGTSPAPVSDYELATRLSYFLWSSMPDAELLAAAESGRLHDPEALKAEARRMLAAPASRRLAEEFGTQWLHVHGFSTLDEKNADLFPTFADLRSDMEEETVRFLDDFFRNDRSILSLVDADHTFLNERLAKHYCVEGVTGDEWRRVEGVRKHGRGSILCLATTLSTQAGASRTSPILRGNWLYETILGEKLPKPPKDVPLLAETVPAGLSERQLIAMHSENAACAKCHRRIDPFGFALEEFDAVGRLRSTDASGKPLDTKASLPDGATLDGQESVRAYLLGPRRDQFVRVFCRKLLGYALGRGVLLSDEPLLEDIVAKLAAADYRISVAIDAIVTSPQFLSIRGRDAPDDAT
jgi:mono/diheme cytochrome c family protein